MKKFNFYQISAFLFLLLVDKAHAAGCGDRLCNPLGPNVENIQQLITKVIQVMTEVGAVLCVCYIIYSGYLFVAAQGNTDKLGEAKSTLFNAVIGTLVLLGAATIASVIQATIQQLKN